MVVLDRKVLRKLQVQCIGSDTYHTRKLYLGKRRGGDVSRPISKYEL